MIWVSALLASAQNATSWCRMSSRQPRQRHYRSGHSQTDRLDKICTELQPISNVLKQWHVPLDAAFPCAQWLEEVKYWWLEQSMICASGACFPMCRVTGGSEVLVARTVAKALLSNICGHAANAGHQTALLVCNLSTCPYKGHGLAFYRKNGRDYPALRETSVKNVQKKELQWPNICSYCGTKWST